MGAGASTHYATVKPTLAENVVTALAECDGVSAQLAAGIGAASAESLAEALSGMDAASRDRLHGLLAGIEPNEAATGGDPNADIPEEWGWPKEPHEPEDLQEYVMQVTAPTYQEKWDAHLEARAADMKKEDFVAEKAFANLLLNKEGTGEEKEGVEYQGIDGNAFKKGKWYRYLNNKGDCYVYVHNYTRDITATRPANFTDLTDEEKKRLKKLGTYIRELPREIERIYDQKKAIPIVYASSDTSEALKAFFVYDKDCQLLDATALKRVNAKALEESRRAIVNAMTLGKTLAVYLGDIVPDFQEKICIPKNKDTFPMGVFRYGGLEGDMVRDKIYRDEDKEAGQMVCREGFRVCLVVSYDGMQFEMSSMKKEELPAKIPDFQYMEEVRCYNDDDKKKILEAMRDGKT